MFVKICGVTNEADARAAVAAGADAVGFVFAPSTRQVTPEQAAPIVASLPDGVVSVGVFKGQSGAEVLAACRRSGVRAAQLHDVDPAVTRAVHAEVPMVFVAVPGESLSAPGARRALDDHGADGILLDAPTPGSGTRFDWGVVGALVEDHHVLLAGGLDPDNVADAIEAVGPWGVDVSSGVEAAPGRKDHGKVTAFVERARVAAATGGRA